jgi:hypothetical protein
MSNRRSGAAEAVIPLAPKLNAGPQAGDPLDKAAPGDFGAEAVARIVRTIAIYDNFVTPTTRTKSTTLAHSKSTSTNCSSKSIILISRAAIIRQISPIRRSPNA